MSHLNKTYVLTGVSSGIGAATARYLIARGAKIIGLDLKAPDFEIDQYHSCDLSSFESIEQAASRISEFDGLANIAGVPSTMSLERIGKVNVFGLRHLTEILLPRVNDNGSIVNVASCAGTGWSKNVDAIRTVLGAPTHKVAFEKFQELGQDPCLGYIFSKELVVYYSMLISSRERHRGVRVNSLSPGAVETPILKDFYDTMDNAILNDLKRQAGGRDGRPEELAGPLAFLLSQDSMWVNGQDLIVDGGAEVILRVGEDAVPSKPLQF